MKTRVILLLCCFLLAGCVQPTTQPDNGTSPENPTLQPSLAPAVPSIVPTIMTFPNPASAYCEQQGNKLDIRSAAYGSQSGACIFPDGSECDEWAYYRGECSPASQSGPTSTPSVDPASLIPTEMPTPLAIDPADYAAWWTYTNASYKFSLRLPPDWVVDETTTSDPLMNGHLLMLRPQNIGEDLLQRVTFRRVGEDALLWPTGVGSGELISQGTLDVAGQPARRVIFVCPTGQVNAIWYHGGKNEANIQRGDLEFGFIYTYKQIYCQEGYSLGGKVQRVGEMIIASLAIP